MFRDSLLSSFFGSVTATATDGEPMAFCTALQITSPPALGEIPQQVVRRQPSPALPVVLEDLRLVAGSSWHKSVLGKLARKGPGTVSRPGLGGWIRNLCRCRSDSDFASGDHGLKYHSRRVALSGLDDDGLK